MSRFLQFQNPVFEAGKLNVTVRRGMKWAVAGLKPGDTIALVAQDGQTERIVCRAQWVGCMLLNVERLGELPELLIHEHDPACRTFEGLVGELCNVYDLEELDAEELLTVCFFIPDGYTPEHDAA